MEAAIQTVVNVFLKSIKKKESLREKDFESLVQTQLGNILTDTDSSEAVKKLLRDLDANQDGKVGFEEYMKLIGYLANALSQQHMLSQAKPTESAEVAPVAESAPAPETEEEAPAAAEEQTQPEVAKEEEAEEKPAEAAVAASEEEVKEEEKVEEAPKAEEAPKEEEAPKAEEAPKIDEVEETPAETTEEGEKKTDGES